MASRKWSDEESALFIAEVNIRVIWKALAYMVGVLAIAVTSTLLFGDTHFWGITFALSLLPMYPMMEYVVVFVSVLNNLNLTTGRELFFANKAGYKARLKANPSQRLYAPTRNQALIAWGIVLILVVALAAAINS